jgi:hypothetical protein
LNLDLEQINQLVQGMEKETKAIKEEIFRLCWHMRGGVTLTEAYEMDVSDREIIAKIIESNFEITKESGLPYF